MKVSRQEIADDYERGRSFHYERTHVFALWHGGMAEYTLMQSWPNDHDREPERQVFRTHEELSDALERLRASLKDAGWQLTRSRSDQSSWTPGRNDDYEHSSTES